MLYKLLADIFMYSHASELEFAAVGCSFEQDTKIVHNM